MIVERFAIASRVDRRALLDALRGTDGVVDVVLAEDSGAAIVTNEQAAGEVRVVVAAPPAPGATRGTKLHTIRVVYDGEDLSDVAAAVGATPDEVVAMHAAATYEVAMIGFMPGFAYLRGGHPRLDLPRRAPRTRVPRGSVGIAAGYTGIYPFASAGGWNLVGRAVDFSALGDAGATLAIGDQVRFVKEEKDLRDAGQRDEIGHGHGHAYGREGIEILQHAGLAIVVDGGRLGHMHDAIPWSGPLVTTAFERANVACGNEPHAAAIELVGNITLRASGDVTVADDRDGAVVLRDGETKTFTTRGDRVRYVAIGGGVDVPPVMGSRTTLLVAALGGFEGRALRTGDRLAGVARAPRELPPVVVDDAPIAVLPGLEAIDISGRYRISSRSDRTGTRLEGSPIAVPGESLRRKSIPMTLGAIEATPSGLVVLGPDHPTTGGYPLVGVVPERDLARLFARPFGAHVDLHVIAPIRLDGGRDPH